MPDWQKRATPVEGEPVPVAPDAEGPSKKESALQGFGQGASFGFSDELAGAAAEAAYLGTPLTPGVAPFLDDETAYQVFGTSSAKEHPYTRVRNAQRGDVAAAEKANPIAYHLGQAGGAIASPGPRGLGLRRLAAQGAAYGAASGAGLSDADVMKGELGRIALDTALSAGTGAVLTPVASGVSARLGRWLQRLSQQNALKAVGARAGISDVIGSAGIETADDARQLGQRAIDMDLVRPFSSAADVAEGAGFRLQQQGARIEGVLSDADRAGVPFDTNRASWRAVEEVMGPDGLTTEAMSKVRPSARIVDRIAAQGDVDPSFRSANRLKSDIYDGINYSVDPGLSTRMQRNTARGLRSSIEEQVEERLGAEAADELRSANENYGTLRTIQGLASESARRQLGQAGAFSPGMIAASVVAGNPAPMVAKAASPIVPSTLSWAQRSAAPAALPTAQRATRAATQELSEMEENSIDVFLNSP